MLFLVLFIFTKKNTRTRNLVYKLISLFMGIVSYSTRTHKFDIRICIFENTGRIGCERVKKTRVVNGSASSGRKNRYIDTAGGKQWIGCHAWCECLAVFPREQCIE